jgi:hypothetical protein
MKIVKRVVIVVFVLIGVVLIAALFVPRNFKGEATVVIDKPRQEVFDYIRKISNQREFSAWFQMDPDIRVWSEGEDGQEGFMLKWESDKVGNGSQTITLIVPNDSLLTSLNFGFGDPVKGYFGLKDTGPAQTEVTWGMSGRSPYPWNLVSVFMNLDNDFETGTRNLKKVLEERVSPTTDI